MNAVSRKEALKRIGLMIGGAVSAPVASAFLKKDIPGSVSGLSFTEFQERLLGILADIIIPETDTPGATAAGVLPFISEVVFVMYNETERNVFFRQMEAFESGMKERLGTSFDQADERPRKDLIYDLHRTAYTTDKESGSPWDFIRTMKELTIAGYFNTEAGMTQVLQYQQTPGQYRACISFEDAGGRVHARGR